ncbi:MAG: glycosyltransferase family 1 protein [Pseudolabrys sp.]|nr:glycosyltransferase family 1 protein [Pseudolabrys sp.]MDP2298586.1 glycosyltransferase family 1 protein [Pseudolabrys sp.]
MKILVATDAWQPQVNGVVRTLGHMAYEARALGVDIDILSPLEFHTLPMPGYPEIRLALTGPGDIERRLDRARADAVHIATEGPIGHAVRRVCRKRGMPFTTSFHTRFPDYLAGRLPLPERWTTDLTWAWLRRFHAPSAAVLAATPTLRQELIERGFNNVKLWSRGVDAHLYRPDRRQKSQNALDLPRSIFLTVGRVAVEKNLEAFLKLDLPGTRLVVGDGPAREHLAAAYPDAVFAGAKQGEELADIYASADVFVFPSRTDTFGLVLLEALASGVPVAAFPAAAPRDVIGDAPVGRLNEDLRLACLEALELDRAACRAFAEGLTWEACARTFIQHVTEGARAWREKKSRAERLKTLFLSARQNRQAAL